jgi:hypothetical protein
MNVKFVVQFVIPHLHKHCLFFFVFNTYLHREFNSNVMSHGALTLRIVLLTDKF